jgi:membrane protease YdiL (CAAX protease family)
MNTRMNTRLLALGVVITALWAAAFRVGVTVGAAVEALSLASVLAVIVVVRAVPEVRALLRPTVRDVVIGVVFGAFTVGATVLLYPPLRDLALVPGLADEVRRFYGIVPFTLVLVPLIVLVAAAEELVWRGLFLAAFPDARVGILVGALAYGLGQLGGSPMLGAVALFFGVLWGVQAKLTRGLVAPMVSHLMWTTAVFGVWPLET